MAKRRQLTPEEIEKQQKTRKEALEFDRDTELGIERRLYEVMREVWYIEKYTEGNSPYSTVEHDDVTRAIRPSFIKHGLFYHISSMDNKEILEVVLDKYDSRNNTSYKEQHFLLYSEFNVRFVNVDKPEQSLEVPTVAVSMDKNPMTLSGKNISYGVKMAILKTLNLESGDLEDVGKQLTEADPNAVAIYNILGEELFGDEWDKIGKKKIYQITNRQTAEAERAPTWALNEAIKNMYELKAEKEENPDKDIEEINKEKEKENDNNSDIMADFED